MPSRRRSTALRNGCLATLTLVLIVRPLIAAELFVRWATALDLLMIGCATTLLLVTAPRHLIRLRRLRFPLLGWSAALLMGLAIHGVNAQAKEDLIALAGGPLVACAAAMSWGRYRRWLLTGIVTVASLIGVFAIWQTLVILPILALRTAGAPEGTVGGILYQVASRGRPLGTFAIPTLLASYLSLMVPISLAVCLRPTSRPLLRWSRWYMVCPVGIAWLLTRSLGAVLSLLAASSLIAMGFMHRSRRWKLVMASVLVGVLCGRLIVWSRPVFLAFSDHHNPVHNRLLYWEAAGHLIREHPILGTGPGTFGARYRELAVKAEFWVKHAHNTYLQIWAEWGLLGLVAWGALLWVLMRGALGLGPWLAIAAWIVPIHNLVDFSFYVPQVSLVWWYLVGWGLRSSHRMRVHRLTTRAV